MIQISSLVRSQSNKLGIGKLINISDSQATVEYFCSIGQRIQKSLPLSSLAPVRLQPQTRCYIWSASQEKWTIGRMYEWDDDQNKYQIDIPDSETISVSEEEIYVRCNVPQVDPIETLAFKGHETPYFHERRLALVKSLTEQRAISRGMTGLISANIELYPHQVEVIRRVLEDPIQRYLLADEVGLGKTIEAGAILRQYLLDEPLGRAVVLVPQYLLEQWRAELEKFYISDFQPGAQLLAVEDVNQVKRNSDLGLLILDEAHHIAAMATSSNSLERKNFETYKQLAHRSDRLLLLSATPVLNHEQNFLAMLHLLDPETYRLDDLESFRALVQKRSAIGRVLLSMRSAQPSELKTSVDQLRNLFAEDQYVINLTDELQKSLQAFTDTNKIVLGISTHISDTYRLHRRMLRNRRATVEDVIFDRNVTPKVEYDLDERTTDIHELMEKWRNLAPKQEEYRRIFQLLFRASGTWLGILKQLLQARLFNKSSAGLTQEFGADDVHILTETDLFAQEKEILQSLLKIIQEPSEYGERTELLKTVILYHLSISFGLQSLRSDISKLLDRVKQRIIRPMGGEKLPKIVIFTSFVQAGVEIVRYLKHSFGENAVASTQSGLPRSQVEQNLSQFKNKPSCFILVCDSSGEEGQNLQFADWMIHFDLPWSPIRLEQRIGRIDRIGRPINIEFTVFAGAELEDSPHDAWYQSLKDGFGIFQQSIASLEFYVEQKLPTLEATLFQSGAKGLLEMIPDIKQEIAAEQVKISEQNALDEIDVLNESATEYFQTLDEYDAHHQEIQRATEGWLIQALQFKDINDVNRLGVQRYQPTPRTLVPVDHLKSQFGRHLEQFGTYNRRVANQNPDVKLHRIGCGLIDAVASYIRWDDRGQAFALWRVDESWSAGEGKEWFGFRFNYVVEASLQVAKQVLKDYGLENNQDNSLKRRTDALFPPIIETVYVDARSEPMCIVEDRALLLILQRQYNQKSHTVNKDYNLAKDRLSIIDRFVDPSQWQNLCRQARSISETVLRDRSDFTELCAIRADKAKQKLENRVNQLRLRQERFSEPVTEELETESALCQALVDGIRHPKIKLDSVGFIIVSGRPLT